MKFCPECGTKVEGMKFCPECGYKIEISAPTDIVCPEFPEDMSLGKETASVIGNFKESKGGQVPLKYGVNTICACENGISITSTFYPSLELHRSQLISVTQYDEQTIKDKSVIGRGVVGLAVGGPIGAVLGGISGVGQKSKNMYYLLIEYWDRETREPVAISFESKKPFTRLIDSCQKNFQKKNQESKSATDNKNQSGENVTYESVYQNTIHTKIVGVTCDNDDGTNRQELLEDLMSDDYLNVVETDFNDKPAYEFRNIYDNVVGYLNKQLASDINEVYGPGVYLNVKDFEITGGGEKNYGCNVTLDIFTLSPKSENVAPKSETPEEKEEFEEPKASNSDPVQPPENSKKPFYKKGWFYIVCASLAFIIIMIVLNIPEKESRQSDIVSFHNVTCSVPLDWVTGDVDDDNLYYYNYDSNKNFTHMLQLSYVQSLGNILDDDVITTFGKDMEYTEGITNFTFEKSSMKGHDVQNINFDMSVDDLNGACNGVAFNINDDDVIVIFIVTINDGDENEGQKILDSIVFPSDIENTTETITSTSDVETQPTTAEDTATMGELNALERALSYISSSPFSRKGLIEQLEYEGFSKSEAEYGADNCGAIWRLQALLKAESYLDSGSFSRQGLIDQLEYEGFTHKQAVYGVEAVGY